MTSSTRAVWFRCSSFLKSFHMRENQVYVCVNINNVFDLFETRALDCHLNIIITLQILQQQRKLEKREMLSCVARVKMKCEWEKCALKPAKTPQREAFAKEAKSKNLAAT